MRLVCLHLGCGSVWHVCGMPFEFVFTEHTFVLPFRTFEGLSVSGLYNEIGTGLRRISATLYQTVGVHTEINGLIIAYYIKLISVFKAINWCYVEVLVCIRCVGFPLQRAMG